MRDLIVLCIKQFIELLRKRGITIDTRCAKDKKKKTPIAPLNIKQETNTSSNLFDADILKIQYDYSEAIHNQLDTVEEIKHMFTMEEISLSIVSTLIHASINNLLYYNIF